VEEQLNFINFHAPIPGSEAIIGATINSEANFLPKAGG
jgi:hypothetical protein